MVQHKTLDLLASSSSQMPGMMGQHMGMQNMTAMMGQNMGMQNMRGMMGQHMMFMQNMIKLMGKNMTGLQKMMTLLAKRMTGVENMLIIMAKHMGIQNMTRIHGPRVSDTGQSKTISIVKGASDPSSAEPYNPSPLSVPLGTDCHLEK